MSYLVLFALLILPIGDAALSATFQYPVCANSQECLENPELMGGQHGECEGVGEWARLLGLG